MESSSGVYMYILCEYPHPSNIMFSDYFYLFFLFKVDLSTYWQITEFL